MRRLVLPLLLSGLAALASSCSEAQATVVGGGCKPGMQCTVGRVSTSDGTSSAPAFTFASDSDTGVYRPEANQCALVAGGTPMLTATSSNVHVGASSVSISTPSATDDVLVVKTSANAGNILFGVGHASPQYASLLAGNQSTRAAGVFRFSYQNQRWEVTSAGGSAINAYIASETGTITSKAASGTNGFACATNGCRFDIGAGSDDYFRSDGTRIETPTALQFDGVATASLGTAAANEGALQYDTDDNRLKTSDGTAWGVVALAEEIHGYSSINVEEQPFAVKNAAHPGKVYEGDAQGVYGGLRFVVTTAGSGAGSAVLKLTGSGGTTCTVSFACDLVAGSVVGDDETIACSSSDTAVVTADTDVLLSWNSTSNCTTLPSGNASATWR